MKRPDPITEFRRISAGLFFLLLAILMSNAVYTYYKIIYQGKHIEATITALPNRPPRSKWDDTLKFIYNGQVYEKDIIRNDTTFNKDTLHVGGKIKLIYLAGYERNFLFESETYLLYGYGLAFIGCIIIVYFTLRKELKKILVYIVNKFR